MGKFLPNLLILGLLVGCGGQGGAPASIYPNILPHSSLWPLSGHSSYAEFTAQGQLDEASGSLTWGPETPLPQKLDVWDYPTTLPTDPSQVGVAHCTLPQASGPCNDGLGQIERQTTSYIGEASNVYSALVDPPEPILSNSPFLGENFVVTSRLSSGVSLTTSYRVTGVGPVVTTLLEESPGSPAERIYQYQFNGQLAQVAFGNVARDGSVALEILRRLP